MEYADKIPILLSLAYLDSIALTNVIACYLKGQRMSSYKLRKKKKIIHN
jgi:hypothetical protein